jgi:Flp pilus assembly pilin Flp
MKTLVWLKNSLKSYWNDEEGQTSLEYILLITVVVLILMKFKSKISQKIDPMIDDIFDNKVQQIMQ